MISIPEHYREICQDALLVMPWMSEKTARLPGIQPLKEDALWLRDEVFAAQMGLADWLLAHHEEEVFWGGPDATAQELLERILDHLRRQPDYKISSNQVTRPDGKTITLGAHHPLLDARRLVQQDLCLMTQTGPEHHLGGAALCFPASWSLAEKINQPLSRIHAPVGVYDPKMAQRVQRLFDAIRTETPLWRANYLLYEDPCLFQPRRENARRAAPSSGPFWARVERQVLFKLPNSGAVCFSIHSHVVPLAAIPKTAATRLVTLSNRHGLLA